MVNSKKDCTASLEGKSFQGRIIKDHPIEVELWYGDQDGNKTRKRFSSTDKSVSPQRIDIKSIKFSMPDYTGGDFDIGNEIFTGVITVTGNGPKSKPFPPIELPLMVKFLTNSSGNSTIQSCGDMSSDIYIDYDDCLSIEVGKPTGPHTTYCSDGYIVVGGNSDGNDYVPEEMNCCKLVGAGSLNYNKRPSFQGIID